MARVFLLVLLIALMGVLSATWYLEFLATLQVVLSTPRKSPRESNATADVIHLHACDPSVHEEEEENDTQATGPISCEASFSTSDGLFASSTLHPRFLVTGGAGFIGSHFVKRLTEEYSPHQVAIIDNLSRGTLDNLQDHPLAKNCVVCTADLRSTDYALRYIRGADWVFHLADVVAGVDYVFTHEEKVFRDNILINSNVLRATKLNNASNYVYVGTACSFPLAFQQDSERVVALRENQTYPAEPESSYGWSKLMGEYEASIASSSSSSSGKLSVGILRLHNVYGNNSIYRGGTSQVIPSLIYKGLSGGDKEHRIIVWGNGRQYRDFVHVTDVVRALFSFVHVKGAMDNHGVIQIGSERAARIKEVAEFISFRVFNKYSIGNGYEPLPIVTDTSKPTGDKGRIATCDRAREILHWNPVVSLDSGIEQLCAWIAQDMHIPRKPMDDKRVMVHPGIPLYPADVDEEPEPEPEPLLVLPQDAVHEEKRKLCPIVQVASPHRRDPWMSLDIHTTKGHPTEVALVHFLRIILPLAQVGPIHRRICAVTNQSNLRTMCSNVAVTESPSTDTDPSLMVIMLDKETSELPHATPHQCDLMIATLEPSVKRPFCTHQIFTWYGSFSFIFRRHHQPSDLMEPRIPNNVALGYMAFPFRLGKTAMEGHRERITFYNEMVKANVSIDHIEQMVSVGQKVYPEMDFSSNRGHESVDGMHTFYDDGVLLMRSYRYVLLFENSDNPGWITERILTAFLSGSVPIYWGTRDVLRFFNPASFIYLPKYNNDPIVLMNFLRNRVDAHPAVFKAYQTARIFQSEQAYRDFFAWHPSVQLESFYKPLQNKLHKILA